MGKKYYYFAFGLQFESDILLPELLTGTVRSADVKIVYGQVPDDIPAPQRQGEYDLVTENACLFRIDGVASYYVTNGQQIVVQLFNADLQEVRLYLLGTVMGILLMQRGILPIHGSAVVVDGHGVMFVGVSGAGKSTVAAGLHKNGHSLLTDDLSAVEFDTNGLPWIHSGYPQQKVWQDSASMLGIDITLHQRICQDMDKYAVPVFGGFYGHSIVLNAIYEITVQPGNTIALIPVKGVEKVLTIMKHTYRSELLEGLGLRLAHFKKCAMMAKYIPVFRWIRPENAPSLDRQIEDLERHFVELFGSSEKRING